MLARQFRLSVRTRQNNQLSSLPQEEICGIDLTVIAMSFFFISGHVAFRRHHHRSCSIGWSLISAKLSRRSKLQL